MEHQVEALGEEARQQRIAENKRRLATLGVLEARRELEASTQAERPRPAKKPKTISMRERIPPELQRRSNRLTGADRPDYREFRPLDIIERRPRANTGCCGGSRGSRGVGGLTSYRGGWHPGKGVASTAATDRAWQAAEELVQSLDSPAFAKEMSDSMVSSGFWCNAPPGLSKVVKSDKAFFTAYLPEVQKVPEDARYLNADGDGWRVVWLPRGQGDAGFSGGWAGFSKDLDLYPGDVVVYQFPDQALAHRDKGTKFTLIFHVFRAFDYETEAVKAARAAALAAGAAAEDAAVAAVEAATLELPMPGEGGSSQGEGQAGGPDSDGVVAGEGGSSGSGLLRAKEQQEQKQQRRKIVRQQPVTKLKASSQPAAEPVSEPAAAAAAAAVGRKPARSTGGVAGGKQQKVGVRAAAQAANAKGKQAAAQAAKGKVSGRKCNAPSTAAQARKRVEEEAGLEAGEEEKELTEGAEGAGAEAAEEPQYIVERIMDVKEENGVRLYLIKWEGYPASENSWEPRECLDAEPSSYRRAVGLSISALL